MKRICYFVSPHGFGHATRAAAVICALQKAEPNLEVIVITTVPRKLFDQSVVRPVSYFRYMSDVGLVQSTPLEEDLPATMRLLDEMLPFETGMVRDLVERLSAWDCELIVCDIAPLGIAVAREAGVPSLLIENFTWDWIYNEYVQEVPDIVRHVEYLETLFDKADFRIRAQPVCGNRVCDLIVKPIFRSPRRSAPQVREKLGITNSAKLVLVTMGGTPAGWSPHGELHSRSDVKFVVPSSDGPFGITGSVVRVPVLGDLFHPDLVGAADAVITKLGYSTVAEALGVGVPVGYITRPRFRESAVLEQFIREQVPTIEIGAESFDSQNWANQLSELLRRPRGQAALHNGAGEAAGFILEKISSS